MMLKRAEKFFARFSSCLFLNDYSNPKYGYIPNTGEVTGSSLRCSILESQELKVVLRSGRFLLIFHKEFSERSRRDHQQGAGGNHPGEPAFSGFGGPVPLVE